MLATDAAVAAPATEAEAVPVAEGLPVAGVLFDTSKVDVRRRADSRRRAEALSSSRGVTQRDQHSARQRRSPKRRSSARRSKKCRSRNAARRASPAGALGDVAELRWTSWPPARDLPDRVVAVDEFRAREAANSKPDRGWPRWPSRVLDRSERVAAARSSEPPIWSGPGSGGSRAIDRPATLPSPTFRRPRSRSRRLTASGSRCFRSALARRPGARAWLPARLRRRAPRKAPTVARTAPPAAAGTAERTTGRRPRSAAAPPNRRRPERSTEGVIAAVDSCVPSATGRGAGAARRARPWRRAGRIVVTSTPAKAAVTINGKWSGRTPL